MNRFEIPDVQFSDHLPLVCDFTIHGGAQASRMSNWTLQVDADRVAWLTADMAGSSANVLSGDMVRELSAKLTEIAALQPVGMIVQSGKASGFIAGADIKEFVKIRTPEEGYALVRAGQSVMQQLEALPCPRSPRSAALPWAADWSWLWPAAIESAPTTQRCRWGCRKCCSAFTPDSAVRSEACSSSACGRSGTHAQGPAVPRRAALSVGLLDELAPPAELAARAKSLLLRRPPKNSAPFVDRLMNLGAARPLVAKQTTRDLEPQRDGANTIRPPTPLWICGGAMARGRRRL